MAEESSPAPAKPERPLFRQPWPGYWQTRWKLKRMRRFQDLVRHKEGWGGDIDLAEPLEKLFPKLTKNEAMMRLEPEIAKLQYPVYWDLVMFTGVRTGVIWKNRHALDEKEKTRNYDVILDYFRLPREPGREHDAFEEVMLALTNGVGVLEARKKRAFWEMFNPVVWLAYLIRLPITIMERAGFGSHEKTQELLIGSYATFMKIAMVLILGFIALKLGVEVPWKAIFERLINFVLK